MPAALAAPAFLVGTAVSLLTSLVLVSRLERVGERLGLSEALLGIVAALAADAPEVTAAVTAVAHHQQRVGAGVILGSNVFNLAALLGLGAVVAGRIGLHRKVVLLGGTVAVWVAAVSLLMVVAASVTMERAASVLGARWAVPELVTGGLVLAAVTSLPNAVAAVYLAGRGRGAATLSTALNSNTLNVVVGLLMPAAVLGLGRPSGQAVLITVWYVALTLAVLALACRHRGLRRVTGAQMAACDRGATMG